MKNTRLLSSIAAATCVLLSFTTSTTTAVGIKNNNDDDGKHTTSPKATPKKLLTKLDFDRSDCLPIDFDAEPFKSIRARLVRAVDPRERKPDGETSSGDDRGRRVPKIDDGRKRSREETDDLDGNDEDDDDEFSSVVAAGRPLPPLEHKVVTAVVDANAKALREEVECMVCLSCMNAETLATLKCDHVLHESCYAQLPLPKEDGNSRPARADPRIFSSEHHERPCPACRNRGPHDDRKKKTVLRKMLRRLEDENAIPPASRKELIGSGAMIGVRLKPSSRGSGPVVGGLTQMLRTPLVAADDEEEEERGANSRETRGPSSANDHPLDDRANADLLEASERSTWLRKRLEAHARILGSHFLFATRSVDADAYGAVWDTYTFPRLARENRRGEEAVDGDDALPILVRSNPKKRRAILSAISQAVAALSQRPRDDELTSEESNEEIILPQMPGRASQFDPGQIETVLWLHNMREVAVTYMEDSAKNAPATRTPVTAGSGSRRIAVVRDYPAEIWIPRLRASVHLSKLLMSKVMTKHYVDRVITAYESYSDSLIAALEEFDGSRGNVRRGASAGDGRIGSMMLERSFEEIEGRLMADGRI